MYMGAFPVYVCILCGMPEEGVKSLGNEGINCCKLSCGFCILNRGPLDKQPIVRAVKCRATSEGQSFKRNTCYLRGTQVLTEKLWQIFFLRGSQLGSNLVRTRFGILTHGTKC